MHAEQREPRPNWAEDPKGRAIAAVMKFASATQAEWIASWLGLWPEGAEPVPPDDESAAEIAALSSRWSAAALRGVLSGENAVGLVFDESGACVWVGGAGVTGPCGCLGLSVEQVGETIGAPHLGGLFDRACWWGPVEMHPGGRPHHGERLTDRRVLLVLG